MVVLNAERVKKAKFSRSITVCLSEPRRDQNHQIILNLFTNLSFNSNEATLQFC